MRKLAIWILLAGFALRASAAAVRVNVQGLEQVLTASEGRTDAQIAERLSGVELTERLSELRLSHLEAKLPGAKSRARLMLLADASAFLELPAADVPATPEPDSATQVALLGQARDYVANHIHSLPNFLATRETTSYVSTSADIRVNSINTVRFAPFEEADASSVTVVYRDGRELAANGDRHRASARVASTRGEFGPILSVVLDDSINGHLSWRHWEQGLAGPLAVFQYEVPQSASHYQVTSPGLAQKETYSPAYHGEMALDPASGSILRLTLIPEMKPDDPMTSANLMVDYGPVEIGGSSYICPVRSVAFAQVRVLNQELDAKWDRRSSSLGPPQTYLNEVNFTRYHLFHAEVRILGPDQEASSQGRTSQGLGSQEPSSQESKVQEPNGQSQVAENAVPVPARRPTSDPNDADDAAETSDAPDTPLPGQGVAFSVNDLEQGLARDKTYGISDEEIAHHLSQVQLTERLGGVRAARLEAALPSPMDRQALEALVDSSQFLELPDADIPARPAPSRSAQAAMLAAAMNYVQKTLPKLPALSASGKTTCFADTPAGKKSGYQPLHQLSGSSVTVHYADGHEVVENEKQQALPACDLADIGEFGPVLATVLSDATEKGLLWSHWDNGESGLRAVFSYRVPQTSSHDPLAAQLAALNGPGSGSAGEHSAPPGPAYQPQHAYHGEIALNPSDGSILRLTVTAELNPDQPVRSANFVVEYAPVEVAGVKCICPKKTVALYQTIDPEALRSYATSGELPLGSIRTIINDGVFAKYHLH